MLGNTTILAATAEESDAQWERRVQQIHHSSASRHEDVKALKDQLETEQNARMEAERAAIGWSPGPRELDDEWEGLMARCVPCAHTGTTSLTPTLP